ncbi:MAG: class IV adenylate cyclase [Phycisphaerales bacterium]
MHSEIEAKLKVDSLDAVERRLAECGGSFLRETIQMDHYYDTTGRELTRTDKCLRLRADRKDGRERLILAYKGPKEQDDYKKRVEIEIEVSGAGSTESLLEALGYARALAFNKRRRLWQLQRCEVALDELPLLGVFVEIEGPDSETIAKVQAMLRLEKVPHIMDSYACLIDRELSRLGRGEREVYLEQGVGDRK